MPPKQQKSKADKKKAQKATDDKTFGMKNKNKSAKVQRYVQQVQSQAKQNAAQSDKEKAKLKAKEELAAKKAAEAKRKAEMDELFKPVQVPQKVPFGTDPKTVLCIYFKQGHCERGAKCKFSHDLNIERKSQKKDLYTDSREDDKKNDTMEDWDQKKLEEVVQSKAGKQSPTDIVCKYFLEAIESSKYGWFWECPNGGVNCKYRHALPPGFVLKSKQNKIDKEEISLEEFLDSERHKLGPNLTPVTLESFNQWKKDRIAKKDAVEAAERKQKENRMKAGRNQGMSGKDLFDFNPDLGIDDEDEEDAIDLSQYERKEDEGEDDLNKGLSDLSLKVYS